MQLLFYGIFLALVSFSTSKNAFLSLNEDYEKCIQSDSFVELSNMNLRMLVSNFFTTTNIMCLNIQNSGIEFISQSAFSNFTNLQYLNLVGNKLQKRNLDFSSSLRNLKTLVLDKAFRTLDEGQNEFLLNIKSSTLESVYLRYNKITKLIVPQDLQLDNLTKLVLSDNSIQEIYINENGLLSKVNFDWLPQSLKYLQVENNNLEELILINKTDLVEVQARNNGFKTLKVENLPNLQSLLINKESLNEISIKNLDKLEDLILGFDKLDRILFSDFNGLTALQSLELEGKNVSFFDGKIVDEMPSLRSLFVGGSLLSYIPEVRKATNLTYLFLPKNKIESLKVQDFQAMPNLEELNLNDNLIMELEPYTFTGLKKLRILNLEKNLFKFISYSAFESLKSLKKLRLTHNSITVFDGKIVDLNPSLNELYLGNNFLKEFPKISRANSLRSLDMGGNLLQVLDGSEFQETFFNLERLILSFNNLSRINTGAFDNLQNLKVLSLHSNRLQIMPQEWSSPLKKLEAVTLEKNDFNDYEALALNETNFQNIALSYTLRNDYFLYCTLRNGINSNCIFMREFTEGDQVHYFKKKYMTLKMVANGKLKMIPSAEM